MYLYIYKNYIFFIFIILKENLKKALRIYLTINKGY